MANNLGDFAPSTVVYGKFTSVRVDTGAPATLAGTPALSVYKNNSTTQSTSGVTLTADFDSVTGLNHFAIDTSSDGTFYSAGGLFDIVITTGTVNSVSAVGQCVGQFSLNAISSLRPTTAARTLDVSAGGEAGLDWANIGSPTTAVNLSGTNIDTDQVVATVTNMVTANVTQISGDSGAADNLETAFDGGSYNVGGGAIVAASVTGAVGSVTGAVGSVTGNVGGNVNGNVVGSVASVSGNVGGNVTGSVGSVVADVNVGSMSAGALADFFTVDSGEVYGDAIPGSVVYEIAENAGGGGGDPWSTALPGAYSPGEAGYIIGTNLDAAITSRLAPTVASRTLDVTATGAAGVDWGNVENQSTAVNLSGTNIDADQVVATVTNRVTANTDQLAGQTVTAASGVTFPASVASPTNITAGTITTVTNLTNAPTNGDFTATMKTSLEDSVWDATLADHLDSGSTGAALNAAGSAGDPWSTPLPGAYGSGTAGYIIGNNIDAAISSRATDSGVWTNGTRTLTAWSFQLPSNGLANVTAWTVALTGNITGNLSGSVGSVTGLNPALLDVAVSTRLAAADYVAPDNAGITAIQAKTDDLTFTVPNVLDSNVAYVNQIEVKGTGTGGDPWNPV